MFVGYIEKISLNTNPFIIFLYLTFPSANKTIAVL